MASATVELSNRLKLDLIKKRLDFSADTIKACLARSGFVFNKDTYHTAQNFRGSLSISVSFTLSTILGSGFSGLFTSGQAITISGATTGSYNTSVTLVSATDSILYCYSLASMASWANGTSVVLITIQDEQPEAYGYSRNVMVMSGVVIGEDDASDVVSITWSCNTSWTATGGSIGPTPGMMMIDDTWSTVIGYISFASAEMVASGNALVVNGVIIRVV